MEDSALADSPTPPLAGPSVSRRDVDEVFRRFDVAGFDWKAFEGTYKGEPGPRIVVIDYSSRRC